MRPRSHALTALALGALVLSGLGVLAQPPEAPKQDKKDNAPAKPQAAPLGFPDLVGALKKSPGCLGVETAQTLSGKSVIFAWFEDKKAVVKWYYGDTHRGIMKKFFPDESPPRPLKHVADDSGPILVIASLTMASKPKFKEMPIPISQIAIELYQPLPGGAALGGRFAPSTVKVPHMKEAYTPQEK
jgi:hypothetical protein